MCPLWCFLLSAQSVSTSIHPRRPPLVPVVVLLLVLCGARCCIGCASRLARSKSKTQKVNAQVLRPSIVGLLELARTTFTTNPPLSSNALTVRQSNLHLVHTYMHTSISRLPDGGPGSSGFWRPFPARQLDFFALAASFALALKKTGRLRAPFTRFAVRPRPPELDFRSPGRPRARFWKPKRVVFRAFSMPPHVRC